MGLACCGNKQTEEKVDLPEVECVDAPDGSGGVSKKEEERRNKWNQAAEEMALKAGTAKKLSVDDRVKLIETSYATVWKLNHDIDAGSLKSVVDPSSWSQEVKDSWNWRRRFAQVASDASDVHVRYLSEKANLENTVMCSLSRTSGKVRIRELPQLEFKQLEGQDLEDRWDHAQSHQLCVDNDILKDTLDVHSKFPKRIYPFLIEWDDAGNTSHSAVLAPVSTISKQAWLQCLSKLLPDALQIS